MKKGDLPDIERDLPTTPEDTDALRRVKEVALPQGVDTLQALYDALPAAARRPRRTTSAGWQDFEL